MGPSNPITKNGLKQVEAFPDMFSQWQGPPLPPQLGLTGVFPRVACPLLFGGSSQKSWCSVQPITFLEKCQENVTYNWIVTTILWGYECILINFKVIIGTLGPPKEVGLRKVSPVRCFVSVFVCYNFTHNLLTFESQQAAAQAKGIGKIVNGGGEPRHGLYRYLRAGGKAVSILFHWQKKPNS